MFSMLSGDLSYTDDLKALCALVKRHGGTIAAGVDTRMSGGEFVAGVTRGKLHVFMSSEYHSDFEQHLKDLHRPYYKTCDMN